MTHQALFIKVGVRIRTKLKRKLYHPPLLCKFIFLQANGEGE